MNEILKALDEALASKEFTINYLRKEVERLTEENCALRTVNEELKKDNENLRGDVEFYKPKGSAN